MDNFREKFASEKLSGMSDTIKQNDNIDLINIKNTLMCTLCHVSEWAYFDNFK